MDLLWNASNELRWNKLESAREPLSEGNLVTSINNNQKASVQQQQTNHLSFN